MKSLEELIKTNLFAHPELAEYKDVVLDFIELYASKRPDMSVEGCKSLIEGLSKFIYFNLNPDDPNFGKWSNLKLKEKFEKSVEILGLDGYEKEFLQDNIGLVFRLGQIRNERGDVSHGHAYPKDSYSDTDFATFIASWAEGLCYFMLSRYVAAKQRQKDESGADVYSAEQYKEFEDYLDSLYPDIERISYSKALKEQDALQYELLMDEYFVNE